MTLSHTPEYNGVAERFNRSILNIVQAFLKDTNLPKAFWGEALLTMMHIYNRLPSESIDGKTPVELWDGTTPDLSNVFVFSSQARVLIPVQNRKKLDDHTCNGIYLGPVRGAVRQHHVWMSDTNRVVKTRDITINKGVMGLNRVKQAPSVTRVQQGLLPLPNLLDDEEARGARIHVRTDTSAPADTGAISSADSGTGVDSGIYSVDINTNTSTDSDTDADVHIEASASASVKVDAVKSSSAHNDVHSRLAVRGGSNSGPSTNTTNRNGTSSAPTAATTQP